ncbi:MAG: CHASE2 domain-containing protein [Bacteroidetes bacterium]|nr:CHASE2 domain-containing protein [Bacteroidota bacterium]
MSWLLKSIQQEKIKFPIALLSSLKFFPSHAKTGFVSEKGENGWPQTKRFNTYQKEAFTDQIEYHFSVSTAMCYDSIRAARFVENQPKEVNIDYRNGRRFAKFSAREVLRGRVSKEDIEGKIVMFGFLGPGDIDKFFTSLNSDPGHPDMYGVEILANIVAQVLEGN